MKNKFSPRKSKNLFKGVEVIPSGYRAYVSIYSAGKNLSKHLGCYKTQVEAFNARVKFLDSLK
jgi:hypothetical protein